MLDWSQISPALKALFSDLAFAGVSPPFEAQWRDRQRNFTHQGTQTDLLLEVTNIRMPPGEDDRLFEMVGAGDSAILAEKLKGDRLITLNVRVESMDQSDALWAWATIERIRTRLDRLTSHARLRTVGLAFVRTMAATALPAPRDRRILSIASMDVLLCAAFEDTDLSGALSWIERVEITGKASGEDGQEMPSPPNSTFTVSAD